MSPCLSTGAFTCASCILERDWLPEQLSLNRACSSYWCWAPSVEECVTSRRALHILVLSGGRTSKWRNKKRQTQCWVGGGLSPYTLLIFLRKIHLLHLPNQTLSRSSGAATAQRLEPRRRFGGPFPLISSPHWIYWKSPHIWIIWRAARILKCCRALRTHPERYTPFPPLARLHLSPAPPSHKCGACVRSGIARFNVLLLIETLFFFFPLSSSFNFQFIYLEDWVHVVWCPVIFRTPGGCRIATLRRLLQSPIMFGTVVDLLTVSSQKQIYFLQSIADYLPQTLRLFKQRT